MKKLVEQEQKQEVKDGKQKVANASKSKQKIANVADSESDTESDSDSENDSESDTDVNDSCVDGLQEVIDFYQNNIGMLSPYGLETLSDYAKEMPNNLIVLAMKKAIEADKRTIQYIKGILNNWHKKGIKTVLDAEKEDKQFRTKQENKKETRNYQNHEQRDMNGVDFSKFYANGGKNEIQNWR